MKIKQILTILLLGSCSTMSHAAVSGFYLGAHAGIQNMGGKVKNSDQTSGGTDFQNIGIHKVAPTVGVHFGYIYATTSKWVFAVEGEVSFDPVKVNTKTMAQSNLGVNTRPTSMELKRDYSLGVSTKIGYQVAQVVPYVRLGLELSRWRHSFTGQILTPSSAQIAGSKRYNSIGFAPGLGVDIPLTAKTVLSIDTRYVMYPKKSVRFNSNSGLSGLSEAKPTSMKLTVGVKFMI